MKKVLLSFIALAIGFMAYAQPVSDHAVIPVSVSLTGILRLNVTSGGNIEFQVNTLEHYTNGIPNSAAYDTKFTVASSVDFKVTMSTEDEKLKGTDNASNTLELNNIGYKVDKTGTDGTVGTEWAIPSNSTVTALQKTQDIITGQDGKSAGDISKNQFVIHWQLGGTTAGSLLSQNLPSDRYSTNVFLTVTKK